jgi:solute carrier family 25 citrate transporter 1
MMEAIFAVTPSETIKLAHAMAITPLCDLLTGIGRTKLIDDSKRPNPQYRGLLHGTVTIVRQDGISGIYRGLFPVVSLSQVNDSMR